MIKYPWTVQRAKELISYSFQIEMDKITAQRFHRLLALLHYNSAWGHSSNFGMFLDGDGSDFFKLKDESVIKAHRKGVDDLTPNDVELAGEDSFYSRGFRK
jgi:hypothetical protein